jgi:hypothetical protein
MIDLLARCENQCCHRDRNHLRFLEDVCIEKQETKMQNTLLRSNIYKKWTSWERKGGYGAGTSWKNVSA